MAQGMSQRNQYSKLTPTPTLNNKVFFLGIIKPHEGLYSVKKKILDIISISFIFIVFYILLNILKS